jgi:ankyrin repeat protein
VIGKITSYLKVFELYQLRLVSWDGKTIGSNALIKRAEQFGFHDLPFAQATQRLGNLFREVKLACEKCFFSMKYINPQNLKHSEDILNHLENISHENFVTIFTRESAMCAPHFSKTLLMQLNLRSKEIPIAIQKHGVCILTLAAKFGAQNIIESMLNHGVNINSQTEVHKETALIEASRGGSSIECFEFLIEKGANVNLSDSQGRTPLQFAVVCKAVKHLTSLIKHKANINAADIGGYTPLMKAYSKEIARLLIQAGADVNAQSYEGYSVLMCHIDTADDLEICLLLIENGAQVNHTNNYGNTHLHQAARMGKKELVELLLVNGADINIANDYGERPLDLAIRQGHQKIVDLLTPHKIDP